MAVRVVIAEDEAIVRLDLKEIMEEEGYEVVGETGRGDEAIELVRAHLPRSGHSLTSRCQVWTDYCGPRRSAPTVCARS